MGQPKKVVMHMRDYSHKDDIIEINFGKELLMPAGMRPRTTARHSLIRFYKDSLSFRSVGVSEGVRFWDARQLFDKANRMSCGASYESKDIPAPLVMAQYLMMNQVMIPARLRGRIIVFAEEFLVDFTGKEYVRTLEYNRRDKCWKLGLIEAFGSAFYPELFVVARCKLFFGNYVAKRSGG